MVELTRLDNPISNSIILNIQFFNNHYNWIKHESYYKLTNWMSHLTLKLNMDK